MTNSSFNPRSLVSWVSGYVSIVLVQFCSIRAPTYSGGVFAGYSSHLVPHSFAAAVKMRKGKAILISNTLTDAFR